MNSEERKEVRYQRRKAKRQAKRNKQIEFDTVFTYSNLWKSHLQSIKGVCWKASVQRYRNHAISNLSRTYHELHNGKFKSRGFYEFDIIERGKARHIQSVHISERVVQRCLCDYALVPMLRDKLIFDNGACIKGKGIDFSLNRMTYHLTEYYKETGSNEGYALVFDFSKYFDNIDHDILVKYLSSAIKDKRIRAVLKGLIDDFGDKGLGLGSQISQICALFLPTPWDRFVKEQLSVKYYGRYMDDGYIIHQSKEYLQKCLVCLRIITSLLHIRLNQKKTQIIHLRRGIVWLKTRFVMTETGKIYRKPYKKSIVRMRRKFKTFKKWLDVGHLTMTDINTSYQSWRGHIKKSNSFLSVQAMNRLYYKLFIGGQTNGSS